MTNNVSLIVQSRTTQRNIATLQQDLISRGNEVTLGKKEDLTASLKGEIRNFVNLNSIRSSLENRQERLVTGDNRLSQMGIAISEMTDLTEPFQQLQTQLSFINQSNIDVYIEQSENALDGMQNVLNVQWGGRYLFSGDTVLDRPINDIQQLTNAVEQVLTDYAATLPTGLISDDAELQTVLAEIDTIFDDTHPTLAFSDLVYNGGDQDMAGIEIAEGEILQYGIRADSQEFRNALKGLAMITATETLRTVVTVTDEAQLNTFERTYLDTATGFTSGGLNDMINAQASLGLKQERIQFRQEGLDRTIFEYEQRIGLYENADQYEAGVAYSEIQRQLELSFYVTSNISQLSLLNYI